MEPKMTLPLDIGAERQLFITSGGRGLHRLMTRPFIEKLGRMMSAAQQLVKRQPLYERRLAGVAAGYEFSRRVCDIMGFKKAGQDARVDEAFYDLVCSSPALTRVT